MNRKAIAATRRQLTAVLSGANVKQLACETGFVQRERKIRPFPLYLAILSSFASQTVTTIADLLRGFNAFTEQDVRYKPFHKQLVKSAFPVFMKALFVRILEQLRLRVLRAVPQIALGRFEDIIIHDGTSFALHDDLADDFPGRFTTIKPAAVEVHTTMSLFGDRPTTSELAPDTQGERDFLPTPETLCGKLLLVDRGYHDVKYSRKVDRARGYILGRIRKDANPTVVGLHSNNVPSRFIGERLKAIVPKLKGRNVDLEVQFPTQTGKWRVRLVLIWNKKQKSHMRLLTNLSARDFRMVDVRRLYGLRWQVELVFKEWKSHSNLHSFATRKPEIAEGLIWTALAAGVLKRFFAHAAQLAFQVETSTLKVAKALRHHLPRLIASLLSGWGTPTRYHNLLAYLASQAKRAHPKRDRKSGRLKPGLQPRFGTGIGP